jgi:hypothetical protein
MFFAPKQPFPDTNQWANVMRREIGVETQLRTIIVIFAPAWDWIPLVLFDFVLCKTQQNYKSFSGFHYIVDKYLL